MATILFAATFPPHSEPIAYCNCGIPASTPTWNDGGRCRGRDQCR